MNIPEPTTALGRQRLLVLWVLWFAFLQGIPFYWYFLGRSVPGKPIPPDAFPWLVCLFPVLLSGVVRWQVLPRVTTYTAALATMVVGIAFAETTCFFGIFLAPSHKDPLILASALGIAQFAPFWAGRVLGESTPSQPPVDPSNPLSPR